MRTQTSSDAALGIFVTSNRVDAILLRQSGEHFDVVSRMSRQRHRKGERVGAGSLATVLPGLRDSGEADFTIEVGDGGGASTFLSSEFAGLGAGTSESSLTASQNQPAHFVPQLRELLGECAKLGYPNPRVAFCIGAPDVSYVELFVARDEVETANSKPWDGLLQIGAQGSLGVSRRRLLELLAAQHRSTFPEARVAFLPMTPLKGQRRFLALVPESGEPVTATLTAMAAQHRDLLPSSQMLRTELSLYTTLARRSLAPAENENTAIVRISSEDTLIVFLSGTHLRHFERLRSLTAFDPPETICSRVLLQQDEQKIGELHQVIVLSEVHTEHFREAFQRFYPNAAIEPIQHILQKEGVRSEEEHRDELRPSSIPAVSVALELLKAREQDDPFSTVNLLPKKLLRKPRQKLMFAWHTLAMLVVLFGVTYFFAVHYLEGQAVVDRNLKELQLNPPDPALGTPEAAQARVDSLKQVYRQFTHALGVLDSLLVGSDQWSRTLEKTARATEELPGVWFESWQPTGSSIRIKGNALSRTRVPQLAYRLEGSIEATDFADVKDVRIYPFTMIVPRPIGTPRVADYLEDAADGVIDDPGSPVLSSRPSSRQPSVSGRAVPSENQ